MDYCFGLISQRQNKLNKNQKKKLEKSWDYQDIFVGFRYKNFLKKLLK